jgi:hypothetical protein
MGVVDKCSGTTHREINSVRLPLQELPYSQAPLRRLITLINTACLLRPVLDGP